MATPNRRDFLYGLGAGLGSVALSSMLQGAQSKAHLPGRAKRCIFLMMEGGPSHIDTFDPKPELDRRTITIDGRIPDRAETIGGPLFGTPRTGYKMPVLPHFQSIGW